MSILVSGDFHASEKGELHLITKRTLIKRYGHRTYGGITHHIILGDAGFMWPNKQKKDSNNYETLAKRRFPVLCVIGNHEPILGMSNMTEADIGIGETVYQINDEPFVAYLKRGKAYTINGFRVLVLGGALSTDKDFQQAHNTWWELEYWTDKEKHDVFKLLDSENTFDLVVSHTGPHHINKLLFKGNQHITDEVALLNDDIHGRIQFHEWWCGHWHRDKYHFDAETRHGYQYLYRTTKVIDNVDGKLAVYNEYGKTRDWGL
jgi:hypothetical protein